MRCCGLASGTTKGTAGVLKNFGDIMEWTQGTYHAGPTDYLGSDEHVVDLARVMASRPDRRRLDVDELVVFRVRDGRLAEAQHMAYGEKA